MNIDELDSLLRPEEFKFVDGRPPFKYITTHNHLEQYSVEQRHQFLYNIRNAFENFCFNMIWYSKPSSEIVSQTYYTIDNLLYSMFGESLKHQIYCTAKTKEGAAYYYDAPVLTVNIELRGRHYLTMEYVIK